jgi:hypothetical protein
MVGHERDDDARSAIARSKESGARGITRSRRGDGQAGVGNVRHHGLAGASSPSGTNQTLAPGQARVEIASLRSQ